MAAIGFIGLGNMGLPMAGNLVKAGHSVRGFDLLPDNMERAAALGVASSRSVTDATSEADVIITMLPAGTHVLSVYRQQGFLTGAKPGTLFIDSSTIDVGSARSAHELATAAGMLSLDAPVSGGVAGAEAASLTFMTGGTKAAFDKAKPVLEAMGKRIVHCGEGGAGQAAKICNNMILAISMIGVAEAFVLAEKLGLSHQALFDVASTSSGRCWALDTYCPVPGPVPASPANKGYKPGFSAALMMKDLGLAQEAASASAAATPLGAEAAQLYRLFVGSGRGGEDFSGIINFIRGKQN